MYERCGMGPGANGVMCGVVKIGEEKYSKVVLVILRGRIVQFVKKVYAFEIVGRRRRKSSCKKEEQGEGVHA